MNLVLGLVENHAEHSGLFTKVGKNVTVLNHCR